LDYRGIPNFGANATNASATIAFGNYIAPSYSNNDVTEDFAATAKAYTGDWILPIKGIYANRKRLDN